MVDSVDYDTTTSRLWGKRSSSELRVHVRPYFFLGLIGFLRYSKFLISSFYRLLLVYHLCQFMLTVLFNFLWRPRQESNLHYRIRSSMSYPLNDKGMIVMDGNYGDRPHRLLKVEQSVENCRIATQVTTLAVTRLSLTLALTSITYVIQKSYRLFQYFHRNYELNMR